MYGLLCSVDLILFSNAQPHARRIRKLLEGLGGAVWIWMFLLSLPDSYKQIKIFMDTFLPLQ
jgi:hypothetical protein